MNSKQTKVNKRGPNDEERGQPHVPNRTSLARPSSSVSFALGERMNIDDILGDSIAFGELLRDPKKLPEWAWLYTNGKGPVGFTTMCRATLTPSQVLSEEECASHESLIEEEGFGCLISRAQIEDIIANLCRRHPIPTQEQLEEAVRFYLMHDAFIVA